MWNIILIFPNTICSVIRDASQKEIKKAYYQLAKKYHPDSNKNDPNASKKFQEVIHCFNWRLVQVEIPVKPISVGVRSIWDSWRWGKTTTVWHLWVCWRYYLSVLKLNGSQCRDLLGPNYSNNLVHISNLGGVWYSVAKLHVMSSTQFSRWFHGWDGRPGWLPWKYRSRGAFQVNLLLEPSWPLLILGQYLVIVQAGTPLQEESILAR